MAEFPTANSDATSNENPAHGKSRGLILFTQPDSDTADYDFGADATDCSTIRQTGTWISRLTVTGTQTL